MRDTERSSSMPRDWGHPQLWVMSLAICIVTSTIGRAADDAPPTGAASRTALAIPLRQADPESVAKTLQSLFPDLHVEAERRTNMLMIMGTREQLDQVQAAVEIMDGPAAEEHKSIAIEVAVIEQTHRLKPDAPVPVWEEIDPAAVLDGGDSLSGKVTRSDYRLRTLDRQQTTLQLGGVTPVLQGRSIGPGRGGASNIYQQESVGTLITAMPAIDESGKIVMELNFESSQLGTADSDEIPPTKQTTTLQTTVQLESGKAVAVGGSQSRTQSDSEVRLQRQLVIVRAQVIDE